MKLLTNQKQREIIPIFFAVDDNYAPYLAVALRSLIDNASRKHRYEINVLIDTLSEANRSLISDLEDESFTVRFISVTEKLRTICSKLHIRDYYTRATYYRFFVPDMFPEYDRGLYLDCDIIVTGDISELYHARLGKNLVAAINEEVISEIDEFGEYSEQVLGISRFKYFNAGILLMNLHEMRRIRIEERFAELLEERIYTVAQDQDYLNVICKDKVTMLGLTWNKTPMPGTDLSFLPNIIHYKINFKPWRYDGIPFGEEFWKYARKTPCYSLLWSAKENYTDAERKRDSDQYDALVALAVKEVECELRRATDIYIEAEAI